MKGSKGFLLLELAVVFLLVGILLLFVSSSFRGCIKALSRANEVQQAQALAEEAMFNEVLDVPANWQVNKEERMEQGINLKEVQILDVETGKIIFNLFWAQ